MVVVLTIATTIASTGVMSCACLTGKMVDVADGPVSYKLDTLVINARLTCLSDGSVA